MRMSFVRAFSEHVPQYPTWTKQKREINRKISLDEINRLERLALVDFANADGVKRLESAIQLADELKDIDVTGVEDMVSVSEDNHLFANTVAVSEDDTIVDPADRYQYNAYLREDVVKKDITREELLKLSKKVEDDFYVAPKGNIPISPRKDEY